jgi:hypothetical protein
MLKEWSLVLAVAASTAAMTLLQPLATEKTSAIASEACAVPTWTFYNISVTYSDDSATPGNGGNATFRMKNSVTNVTESVTSLVPFNFAARINGTPLDPALNVQMIFNPGGIYIEVNTNLKCDGSSNTTRLV